MLKLPTTFQALVTEFDIDQSRQYGSIDREMVEEREFLFFRKTRALSPVRFRRLECTFTGLGEAPIPFVICGLVGRADNLSNLKQGKNYLDWVSVRIGVILDEQDIPEEYWVVMRQMAVAGYRLVYQKADISVK